MRRSNPTVQSTLVDSRLLLLLVPEKFSRLIRRCWRPDTSASGSFATQVYAGSLTTYTDTGLTWDTTYYYKVKATNAGGSSELSTAVSAGTSIPTITTVAGNGTAGYTGDGGPAASAELDRPIGVGVDPSGNLYIGDINNYRIRELKR